MEKRYIDREVPAYVDLEDIDRPLEGNLRGQLYIHSEVVDVDV